MHAYGHFCTHASCNLLPMANGDIWSESCRKFLIAKHFRVVPVHVQQNSLLCDAFLARILFCSCMCKFIHLLIGSNRLPKKFIHARELAKQKWRFKSVVSVNLHELRVVGRWLGRWLGRSLSLHRVAEQHQRRKARPQLVTRACVFDQCRRCVARHQACQAEKQMGVDLI